MTNNIKVNKAKEKLLEIAKRTAKDFKYELGEIPKRVPAQLTGKDSGTSADGSSQSPIVEAMQQKTNSDEDNNVSKVKQRKHIGDKGKVEADIEKYQRKREELKRAWEQGQQQLEENINIEPGQPIMPTSKPSRGKSRAGKQKSVERRKSKK